MATTIRVDPDDELPVILERLPASSSCVLILPPYARALNSVVGARLLARRAQAMGTSVAVVTDDHAVGAHVRAAGLPVAHSVEDARLLLPDEDAGGKTDDEDAPDANDWGEGPPEDAGIHASPTVIVNAATSSHDAAPPPSSRADRDTQAATFTAGAAAAGQQQDGDGSGAATIRGHSKGAGGRRPAAAPARPSTDQPQRAANAPPPARRGPSVLGRLVVPAALLIIPLLLLLWLGYTAVSGLLNPSATLSVQPRADTVTATTRVSAVANLAPSKKTATRVPLTLADQPASGQQPVPVLGMETLPGHLATGSVELANITTKPLLVPAGTAFTTALNRETFVSAQPITLPAAVVTFSGDRWGTGAVPVHAAGGGSAGNVAARAIINVPAQFTGALKVENPRPTTGGTDIHRPRIRDADLSRVSTALFASLEHSALAAIARRAGDVDEHTLFVARSPVQPHYSADRRSATLALSVVVHAEYVRKSDLRPAALAALRRPLAAMAGAQFVPSSLAWTTLWRPDRTIDLSVSGHTAPRLDMVSLTRAVRGLSRSDAEAYLHNRGDIAQASIALSPAWADHLPNDTARIHITVQQPQ